MSRALADMGTDVLPDAGCAFIGLAEVENANVLRDLTAQPAFEGSQYAVLPISKVRISEASTVHCFTIRLFYREECEAGSLCAGVGKGFCLLYPWISTVRGEMAGDIVCWS